MLLSFNKNLENISVNYAPIKLLSSVVDTLYFVLNKFARCKNMFTSIQRFSYMWNNFDNLLAHNATNHRLRFWFSLYTEQ